MKDEHIAENIETTINSVTGILPKGRDNIKNFYLKLTMGKGVKFNL
jgi:ribosomal protein L1